MADKPRFFVRRIYHMRLNLTDPDKSRMRYTYAVVDGETNTERAVYKRRKSADAHVEILNRREAERRE